MEITVLDLEKNYVFNKLEKSPEYSVEMLGDSWKSGQPLGVQGTKVQASEIRAHSVDSFINSLIQFSVENWINSSKDKKNMKLAHTIKSAVSPEQLS